MIVFSGPLAPQRSALREENTPGANTNAALPIVPVSMTDYNLASLIFYQDRPVR